MSYYSQLFIRRRATMWTAASTPYNWEKLKNSENPLSFDKIFRWEKKRPGLFYLVAGVLGFIAFYAVTWAGSPYILQFQTYWGPLKLKRNYLENATITQIRIDYDDKVIKRLQTILEQDLPLQPSLDGVGFRYGYNTNSVNSLVKYWKNTYLPKWKERQEYLNQFDHFVTTIFGLKIHFIHAKPKEYPPAINYYRIPVLLLHGWPGSVREFYDFIPKLTSYSADYPFAFEVVAPSLAGFGFSSAPQQEGFIPIEMANVMHQLMLRLGYDKYIVQGGGMGSLVGSQITTIFHDNVIGYHSNTCVMQSYASVMKYFYASIFPRMYVNSMHYYFHFPIWDKIQMLIRETGYFHIQATKPDTIGIALATSPVGLAVYILEKFALAFDLENIDKEDGGLLKNDTNLIPLLDNIMIYYLTNTITSSMRFYAETMSDRQRQHAMDIRKTRVPTACARFKNDFPSALDYTLEIKYLKLIQSTYYDFGGHFAALQEPETLYNDFVDFVKKLNTTMFT